jgi:hypothetical protein
MGASLKTTWLQMGFDGIKIETSSMMPPPMPSSRAHALPSSIDVDMGSIEADLVEESGPRAAQELQAGGLQLADSPAAESAPELAPASRPTLSGAVVQPRRASSWVGLALRLTVAFAAAGIVGFVGVTWLTDGPAGVMRAARNAARPAEDPPSPQAPPLSAVAEEFTAFTQPRSEAAEAAEPPEAEGETSAEPSARATEEVEAATAASAVPAVPVAPRRARPRSKGLPPARSFDFGF